MLCAAISDDLVAVVNKSDSGFMSGIRRSQKQFREGDMERREKNAGRYKQEWSELYRGISNTLKRFGENNSAGGDYFLEDRIPITGEQVHTLRLHKLHMLRPAVMKAAQGVLVDHPKWTIEVCVMSPEENTFISFEAGLRLCSDGIIDALDRSMLPERYRNFVYEGSRPPPEGFKM